MKNILFLEGMTCTGCETVIENKLKKIDGIHEVQANYQSGSVEINFDKDKITLDEIVTIIEGLDYRVIKTKETQHEEKAESNHQLIIAGIILAGLYMIIKHTVGFQFIPEINDNMGYVLLFTVGLLSSLHCIAMCGGINLSLCVSNRGVQAQKQKSAFVESTNQSGGILKTLVENEKFAMLRPSFLYNAGRVISYTIIGGFVGALGSVFQMTNMGNAFVSIVAGVFMVIMGLNLLNVFPWLRKLNPRMPKVFAKRIQKEKVGKGPFVVGLLNGFMPCGPLQAMQLYALGTGSFITGALSMFVFSLGTVPLLFLFGALGSFLSSGASKKLIKVSAVLVMVLGFAMMNRGIAFTGNTFGTVTASGKTESATSVVNGDVQEIESTLESGSYPAIQVQQGIPVKWTIMADASSLNGCNREIVIPEYNISQKLVEGENTITFTPNDKGTFGYSCWMGMIRSSITVTDSGQQPKVLYQPEDSQDSNTQGSMGCCGN